MKKSVVILLTGREGILSEQGQAGEKSGNREGFSFSRSSTRFVYSPPAERLQCQVPRFFFHTQNVGIICFLSTG